MNFEFKTGISIINAPRVNETATKGSDFYIFNGTIEEKIEIRATGKTRKEWNSKLGFDSQNNFGVQGCEKEVPTYFLIFNDDESLLIENTQLEIERIMLEYLRPNLSIKK